jgi:hypothetical protein
MKTSRLLASAVPALTIRATFFVGSLSVWWRVGTLAAAAASPQTKPPAGVVAAPGCPPTPARDRWPSGDLGGRPWLLPVC